MALYFMSHANLWLDKPPWRKIITFELNSKIQSSIFTDTGQDAISYTTFILTYTKSH
jgi:hypothetical protein